jgi:hypothetical protein
MSHLAGGMAQVVEYQPGKHKALSSNPSTEKISHVIHVKDNVKVASRKW